MSEIRVFHGSYGEVCNPSLDRGRIDADFGIGFYVTDDFSMAEKWASRKKKAIINEYLLHTDKLTSYRFQTDEEWLNFVVQNRSGNETAGLRYNYDILIGATADDKLFATIEQYESGLINSKTAVKILNCMKVGQQICIRTDTALNNLDFVRSIELSDERIRELRKIYKEERQKVNYIVKNIIQNSNKERQKEEEISL